MGRLPVPVRDDLLGLGAVRRYADGARMIHEGRDDSHVFLLLSGFAKVTMAAGEGQALLAVRGPGDTVGELAATSGHPRQASVVACSPVTARVIVASVFRHFLGRNPGAAVQVAAVVAERLAAANRRRVEFATQPLQTRLVSVLVELAVLSGEPAVPGAVRIPLPLRQGELAAMVGASEDTVQRALRVLRLDGLVETGYRSLIVRDLHRLRAMLEFPAA
ncbi:Crp/Fnr family transcriptional regulator [Micromonospora sp. NBC_01392]|uniref:Crp/Fnr family transcriptional regulator n=1 Tax=Micromonospora sp. NBC_01392 TaxID=2903588 RepID=UPI003246D073